MNQLITGGAPHCMAYENPLLQLQLLVASQLDSKNVPLSYIVSGVDEILLSWVGPTRRNHKRNSTLHEQGVRVFFPNKHMEVSWNGGTPKSSILMGFSLINHPIWGYPQFRNPLYIFLCGTPERNLLRSTPPRAQRGPTGGPRQCMQKPSHPTRGQGRDEPRQHAEVASDRGNKAWFVGVIFTLDLQYIYIYLL